MATRDITAQELYGPLSLKEMGRLTGVGAGNVAQGIGRTARTAYETPFAVGDALAGLANAASSFGAGVRSGFTGENYVGNEYRGLSLKDMFGGTPAKPQQAAPAKPAPAPTPQTTTTEQPKPVTNTSPSAATTSALPQFRMDARSNDMAYQIDPSARGWRPQFEGRGENPNYQGPLSHINVSRDKNGTLTFSGSGRKINQNGSEYQEPPAAQMSRMQQAMAEVGSLFEGGQPRTREDMALAEGLLGRMLASEDMREKAGLDMEGALAQLMFGSSLRQQEAAMKRVPAKEEMLLDLWNLMQTDPTDPRVQAGIALLGNNPWGLPSFGRE